MKMEQCEIIFDRSAFHGRFFKHLLESRVKDAVENRDIVIYHTPVFIEETLVMYKSNNTRKTLKRQIPFILDICNGGFFQDFFDIWHLELQENNNTKSDFLFSKSKEKLFVQNIKMLVHDDKISQKKLSELTDETHLSKLQAYAHKDFYKKLRDEYYSTLKSELKTGKNKKEIFNEILYTELDIAGRNFIENHLSINNINVYEKWKDSKSAYPYLTNFLILLLYSMFYVISEPNRKIDVNAVADITNLMFLTDTNIIVSNDQGFMKDAFEFLFSDRDRKYFSPEEFVNFISSGNKFR